MKERNGINEYNRGGGAKRKFRVDKERTLIELTNKLNRMIEKGVITKEEAIKRLKQIKQ